MRRSGSLVVAPLLLALAACPGTQDPCTPTSQKALARDMMRSWYLYPELMAAVDPADPAYPTVTDFLNAMAAPARAQGKDRQWTYATSLSSTQAFYDAGTAVGFGIGLLERGTPTPNRELVAQVFPGSAAADAGFARGDEILAVGETEATLVDAATLIAGSGFRSALGPGTAGVTRTFRVLTLGGQTVIRTMTKRAYSVDPVPQGWSVIARTGSAPAGYVALRTFITPAEPLLTDVFQQFETAGVQDVVVDLRYNGGGLISTAGVLANLLGGDRATTDLMYGFQNNPAHATQDSQAFFAPPAQAIGVPGTPFRIAFIMTGASASASELVANVLEPFHEPDGIAIVGARSYGKPVGQRGFAVQECDLAVYVVSFRLVNAQGEGGYYDGLPDAAGAFAGPLCAAEDDLLHAPGDAAEASTAAALSWLSTGTCPPAPAAAKASGTAAAKLAPAPDVYPEALQPDEAQRSIRGLF